MSGSVFLTLFSVPAKILSAKAATLIKVPQALARIIDIARSFEMIETRMTPGQMIRLFLISLTP